MRFAEKRKRNQELPQFVVAMVDVKKLPYTTDDESLIKIYCVGRDAVLATGEVVTISGFFQSTGGKYIETLQAGENMLPQETVLELNPGETVASTTLSCAVS